MAHVRMVVVVATVWVVLFACVVVFTACAPPTTFRLRSQNGGCLQVGACDSFSGTCALMVNTCNATNKAQAWRATAQGLTCPSLRVVVEGHHEGLATTAHVDRHVARTTTALLPGAGDTVTVWHAPALQARAAAPSPLPTGAFLVAGAGTSVYWSSSSTPHAPPGAAVYLMEQLY